METHRKSKLESSGKSKAPSTPHLKPSQSTPAKRSSISAKLRAWYDTAWRNRHGPKLKLLGPRYPNTMEFQYSPEGQRVHAEAKRIEGRWVEEIGAVTGG